MSDKFALLALVLGGTFGVIFLYWVFKKCSRRALFRHRRFLEPPGILCALLYAAPLVYLALLEEGVLSTSLTKGQFTLIFLGCFAAATVVNLLRWGIPYGLGFCVCHLVLAGIICLMVGMLIFGIFLLFALLAPMGKRSGGFWIGLSPFGDEFLVLPIGNGWYQDEYLNTYQRTGSDTMLGSDCKLYYIHRSA